MNEKAEHYLSTLGRSPNTVRTYRNALERYFEIAGDKIDNKSYEKFLSEISDYSPSTKVILRTAVMGMFDFLEVDGSEKRKNLNRHYIQREKRSLININEDDIEKTIVYCETLPGGLVELRDKAFVLMAADSGFRIFELCSLKRGDIDWRNERAFIVGKGEKPALVRLSRRSIIALKSYLDARQKMDGETGRPLNTLPLFSQHGKSGKTKKITTDGMRKAIKGRMEEAGVDAKNVRIHDFRHYFVTNALRATNSMKIAQGLARHESIDVTSRYVHLAETELDKAYDEIFNKK